MDPLKPIQVELHPLPPSSATSLLRRCQRRKAAAGSEDHPESDLLRSIKATLHGSDPPQGSETSTIHSLYYEDETALETELTWDAYTAVLSCGGVIRKKWDFSQGNQRIQWACIGYLNQPTSIFSISSTSPARYTSDLHSGPPPIKDPSARETFGPFSSVQQEQHKEVEAASRPKGTFVFFRNIGKVFLSNGIEYTFNLPFVTRRAWPAHPHGVIIQRVFDPSELEEARISGDPPLPTLFSFTNPFAEVAAVGVSCRLLGGFGSRPITLENPPSLAEHQEEIPPQEIVIWVAQRGIVSQDDIALTLDPDVRTMTLWRYVYVDPDGVKLDKDRDEEIRSAISDTSELEVESLRPCFWFEKLVCFHVPQIDCDQWGKITAATFDDRWDRKIQRSLLSVCFPNSQLLRTIAVCKHDEGYIKAELLQDMQATSVASVRSTRPTVKDLLLVKPDGSLGILTHGIRQINIQPRVECAQRRPSEMEIDTSSWPTVSLSVARVEERTESCATFVMDNGEKMYGSLVFSSPDVLVHRCFEVLAMALPSELAFAIRLEFLHLWHEQGLFTIEDTVAICFRRALFKILHIVDPDGEQGTLCWDNLSRSPLFDDMSEDVSLLGLVHPPPTRREHTPPDFHIIKPHPLAGAALNALHHLAEDMRVNLEQQILVLRVASIVCTVALVVRPEWADYWKRLCPDITLKLPSALRPEYFDEKLPQWPPDLSIALYSRLTNPAANASWVYTYRIAAQHKVPPSLEYGRVEPLFRLLQMTRPYSTLGDPKITETRARAEIVIQLMVHHKIGPDFLRHLPLGVSSPLREAIRTGQLSPSGEWPIGAYQLIGRDDLAEGVGSSAEKMNSGGYKTVKEWLNATNRKSMADVTRGGLVSASMPANATVSGVELDMENFTTIRFGQDKRIDEVARMLCSSLIPPIRMLERPELNEHDLAKEQQHHVLRLAERTLALPLGRALFTFGSVTQITREAYIIPKMEFALSLQPQNVVVYPEPGKIPFECLWWGDFHNGVAAGLRISQSLGSVDSSWIKFNKPMELTPEHAGFIYALGLTGHLKEMLTWNTFGYLTPKHDMTSIAVLLGLSAANVGSGNRHVAKLIAVHTPSMLPTPSVDLNVSLITQAAALVGLGLLYMGSKRRHTAELCLTQISRKDLVQPDLSNEHREAYTIAAALAFGMVMLGKGSSVPADIQMVERLRILVHGEGPVSKKERLSFDINLTSPAAAIALGLMYLRTDRRDIADILSIPDTTLGLNRVQPHFLLIRTLARALIMFSSVEPTNDWLKAQIPPAISQAMQGRLQGQVADDAFELAYYNIIAGACFAVALKYAGTAREEAYLLIIGYYDMFSRLAYTNGPAFDMRIKRAAIRDGLNLISLSVNMVMAGTGEINCLRRLRYAYGMYNQPIRYGAHMATYMSLGMLFLGGGRYTLGTSDAAIACMLTAFFPRFPQVSSENKSYLQALRHLWVLAVEPRCLIARDVDSKEIVYLPVKIKVQDGDEVGTTQLISPTLIPDLDKLVSIRVDTPRYWPFYLDIANFPRHKQSLLKSQTLYVKRRTAFLSYMEDPKGSRSLLVRTGSSTSDAATLDFPKLRDTKVHPAGDLYQFISSSSNDPLFLAFADHLCRDGGETEEERVFRAYCHAALLDTILQDKPLTLQSHLTLYRYRKMRRGSRYFNLRLEDLRYVADFYGKVYDRRFSGRSESNPRPPLIRENTALGALHSLNEQLDLVRADPEFLRILKAYVRGQPGALLGGGSEVPAGMAKDLAWYLQQNGVPPSGVLMLLRDLARKAHEQCLGAPEPEGTTDAGMLDEGIREVLHVTATSVAGSLGQGWTTRSLNEVLGLWS